MKLLSDNPKIEIWNDDCLNVLKNMPDKSVDLVLTDPPYGVQKSTWDEELPPIKIWKEIQRVLRDGAGLVVFGGIKYMPENIKRIKKFLDYQWIFAWYKPNAMQFGKTGYSKLDIAIWFSKGESNKIIERKLDIIVEPISVSKNNFGHPTPKPIPVMSHIISCLSRKGDTILDPFLGSGTTGVACVNLNRNFIGIEKEKDYIKIAEARIMRVLNQQKLL